MPGVATIDPRVEVIDGSDDQRASIRRISELRPLPFVVLLGEPGIGKSTVLDVEAAREGAPVFKVRELITGAQPESDVTLWLDALDEYRAEGEPSDKIYGLAHAIATAKGFGRFSGLPSEDLHGVIYLIVLGFAATGIAAMLFFCEESNAGKAFRAIRKDPLLAQSQGINVSASKLCASGRSIPALAVPAYAPASTAR